MIRGRHGRCRPPGDVSSNVIEPWTTYKREHKREIEPIRLLLKPQLKLYRPCTG